MAAARSPAKTPTKVDRSAAYAARYLAKNVVGAGLADKCVIQLSYAIGVARPLSVYVDTFGTAQVDEDKLSSVLQELVDLSPRGIRTHLGLNRPIYARTAAYGHFGREPDSDGGFSWERLDLIDQLKATLADHDIPDKTAGHDDRPRFYGRRRGKRLRQIPRSLIESVLPRLAIHIPPPPAKLPLTVLFPFVPRALWLEVGFGGGEHLAWQAVRNPDVGLIGCEVFENGVASLLGHLQRDAVENVRIFPDDVRQLYPALEVRSLARVFVLFPDPWRKSRHADRRFIHDDNLDILSELMDDNAELRIATDDPTYKAWALKTMAARTDFIDITTDPTKKPEDWPPTRYEIKARDQGREPIFLRYVRKKRD